MDATEPRSRRRHDARIQTLRAISDEARRQLAEVGAAGLSLRAIARELGMVSSGIYRYVASRDELLTRLIVDAYGDLADAVESAVADSGSGDAAESWAVRCRSVRRWALERPHEWALLYGSPVPGYAAPEQTIDPAGRFYSALAGALVGGDPPVSDTADRILRPDAERIAEAVGLSSAELSLPMLGALGHLVGTVSLEVFGHLTGVIDQAARDAHFEVQVALSQRMLGM